MKQSYIRRGRVRRNNWRKGAPLSINLRVSDKKDPSFDILAGRYAAHTFAKSMQFTKFIRIVTRFFAENYTISLLQTP